MTLSSWTAPNRPSLLLTALVGVALDDHELIKVKLGQSFEGDRQEAAEQLAAEGHATLVQVIGRIIVLYRARNKIKQAARKRPQIQLPG